MTLSCSATPADAPSSRHGDSGCSSLCRMVPRSTQLAALVFLGLGAPTLHAQDPGVPTQTIDVDGISTKYHTAGLDTRRPGQPVVVFQSGGGGTPLERWAAVLAGLEGRAAVLAYDRPGIGGTSPPGEPLTVALVNEHLHDLLEVLDIAPPYVLVGHSWGGALSLEYASRYPDEVAGSIYVDPFTFLMTEDGQRAVVRTLADSDAEADRMWEDLEAMREEDPRMDQLPPEVAAELELIRSYAEAETGSAIAPPAHPVTILLALRPMAPPPFPESVDPMEWFRAEREYTRSQFEDWLGDHPNSSVRVLPESTHLIPREAPHAIVEAIDTMLQVIR